MTEPSVAEHIAHWRIALTEMVKDGHITANSVLHTQFDYAEKRGLFVNMHSEKANLWGFGEVVPLFFEPAGGFWVGLYSLAAPTGISLEELDRLFLEDEADEERGDFSVDTLVDCGGKAFTRIVHHDFVMRAFSMHSPWRREFYEKTKELMSHAMVKSGLADTLFSSPTGFTAIAEMKSADGEVLKIQMTIRSFHPETNVPIVASPFDDATEGEEIPITDLTDTFTVLRTTDAVQAFLGPDLSEEEARNIAMRPFSPDPSS